MWWADPDEPGNPNWVVVQGDCRETMDMLADNSVDSIVTDPPYEIGFMNKSWDNSGIAYDIEVWKHALRVLKPGGHLLSFSGSRTYHRIACAIEDAGFEIRDQIMWVYGSGFPKSRNLSGEWDGWGTALKPAHEPIVMARKPFKGSVESNVQSNRTGAINIENCRIEGAPPSVPQPSLGVRERITYGFGTGHGRNGEMSHATGRWPANFIHDGSDEVTSLFPGNVKGVYGAKAIGKVQFMNNEDQTGGSIGSGNGITDTGSAARFFYCPKASKFDREEGLEEFEDRILNRTNPGGIENDPKWAPRVRKNNHPTVKPTELMRYLCRLITAPGGIVLDPFAGSGSTGKAAVLEGFGFIGCELSDEYSKIARARIRHALDLSKSS